MSNESITQAINQIKSAQNILVLAGSGSNLDAVAAGLALKSFLKSQDKQVRVFAVGAISEKFKLILAESEIIAAETLNKNLVIEVSLAKTELAELNYQKSPDALKIFLTAKTGGEFEAADVVVKTAIYPFDLVVTIAVSQLEELGEFYAKHAQLFFQTPVINIDHKPTNDNFGQINLVNLIASSSSEIVSDLLAAMDDNLVDEKIATWLLAGIIFATNSFQNGKTSPQVFQKASHLIAQGAKQQEIISHLYRSKSLGLLHLWGRVLARLKQESDGLLVYSSVPESDIERSGATVADQNEIVPEMVSQLGFAKHFVFLVEQGPITTAFVSLSSPLSAQSLFAKYQPTPVNQQTIKFLINMPIADVEAEVIPNILAQLAKQRT